MNFPPHHQLPSELRELLKTPIQQLHRGEWRRD
jgi:hypothetical protein